MNLLIFDSEAFGHHSEYVEYLLTYLLSRNEGTAQPQGRIVFLVHAQTLAHLPQLVAATRARLPHVQLISIADADQQNLDATTSHFKRALKEASLINQALQEHDCTTLLLLQWDAYQFVLGLTGIVARSAWLRLLLPGWHPKTSRLARTLVRGIWFRPYVQLPAARSIKERLTYLRKRIQLKWARLHPQLENLYLFNDHEGVAQLQNLQKAGSSLNFCYLPDPIAERSFTKIDLAQRFSVAPAKKLVLFVGGIAPRKNLLRQIEAYRRLPAATREGAFLLIAGRCTDAAYASAIEAALSQLAPSEYHLENRYLDLDELESALSHASVVLAAYTDFPYSSGIIGQAAKHGVPLLCSTVGVMARITQSYKLGQTVPPTDSEALTRALTALLEAPATSRPGAQRFFNEHQANAFCKTLLQAPPSPATHSI